MTNLLGSSPKPLPPKPTGATKMSQLKSLLGKCCLRYPEVLLFEVKDTTILHEL